MVQLQKEHFPSRTYAKLSPRELGPFVITKCINNNAYIIDLPSNVFTPPTLNVFNIYPHYPPNNAKTTISSLMTTSTEMKKMQFLQVNCPLPTNPLIGVNLLVFLLVIFSYWLNIFFVQRFPFGIHILDVNTSKAYRRIYNFLKFHFSLFLLSSKGAPMPHTQNKILIYLHV